MDDYNENIHPCCRSIDYINSNMLVDHNFKKFLSDVYEVGRMSAIHHCTHSCFKYCNIVNIVKGTSVCLYLFVSDFKKRKRTLASVSESIRLKLERYKFKDNHMNAQTHELIKYQTTIVPSVLMPCPPRKDNLDERELYAQIVLTLFKPWQDLKEINNLNDWNLSLQEFLISASPEQLKLIDNVECLKKSKDDAETA